MCSWYIYNVAYVCVHTEECTYLVSYAQGLGLFLAFATRKVKIKGLDDAKWIAATIYITSIVLVITILATYTLNERNNTYAAVFSSGLFIGTTFIMAFVFVSKARIDTYVQQLCRVYTGRQFKCSLKHCLLCLTIYCHDAIHSCIVGMHCMIHMIIA